MLRRRESRFMWLVAIQQTPEDRPGDDAGEVEARMTRPTAAPEPVNCSTNHSKAMMVNWSPRYEMLSPSQSRWKAGSRNGAPIPVVSSLFTLCTLARVLAGAFPFNLI